MNAYCFVLLFCATSNGKPIKQSVVIISKTEVKWVLCNHKDRDTYEVPDGYREKRVYIKYYGAGTLRGNRCHTSSVTE